MKYIKNLSEFLFERLNSAKDRKMMDLVEYFDKSIEEKEEELPKFIDNNYPHILENWCMENSNYFLDLESYESEEEALDNIEYPTTRYELKYYPDALKSYKEFLIGIVEDIFNNSNPYDLDLCILPLYVTYSYEGDIEDGWIVHFTSEENIEPILGSQSFHGLSNMYNLAISAGANDDEWGVEGGYCFGFDVADVYSNFKSGYGHYGNEGILFKTSGIKLYHRGDDELQVIFIGNQVSNLIPFWYDTKTKEFYNKDNTIRTQESDDFFDQMINEK